MMGCSPGSSLKPAACMPARNLRAWPNRVSRKLRHVLDEIERAQRDGGDHRRDAVREQVRARALAQPRDRRSALPRGVAAAAAAERLAEACR